MRFRWLFSISCLFMPLQAVAEEPPLPVGLGGGEPALPIGLTMDDPVLPMGLNPDEPRLPMGLDAEFPGDDSFQEEDVAPFDFSAFMEARGGVRLQKDPTQKRASIGEGRLHFELVKSGEHATGTFAADLLYDPVFNRYDVDLKTGEGWLDLREANVLFRPLDRIDIKIGRQILTWGTGDLLFINDLFPKDWNSFFIGRDEEYLKAPSNAVKVAFYHDIANLDIIYIPQFDSDRFIDGRRISYFNAAAGGIVGRENPVLTDMPSKWFREDEISLRLHRVLGTYEVAAYYYKGYWKSPAGQDATTGLFTFPRLSVYGASLRGPLGPGIFSSEVGYYESHQGRDPFINPSEWRFLVGYERELWPEMTANVQYYHEWLHDYRAYRTGLPAGAPQRDEHRHLFALRFTQMMMNQNLTLSLFAFYSFSDDDAYLRPALNYKFDDHWTASVGGNLFWGDAKHTFFGQFEDNNNIYASFRYGF